MLSKHWPTAIRLLTFLLIALSACSAGTSPGGAETIGLNQSELSACGAAGQACCQGGICAVGDSCSLTTPQAPAPVGYWRFDDCSAGSANIADASGNGHVGQKSGRVTCATGFAGIAGSFDGSTGMVQIPDAPAFHLSQAVSAAAWVKPSRITGLHTILNKWYGPDSYMLLIQDGQYMFQVVAGGVLFTVATPATANAWTHVAGVYDAAIGRLSLFVNGALAAQTAATGTLQDSPQPLCIGNCPSWNAFAGLIDEVWLGNAALSQAQIQQLYLPAVGRWRFDDCSSGSSVIIDSSGKGHNGQKLGGIACSKGFSGLAGSFDGATGKVQIPDAPDFHLTNAVTVGAWVNPTNIGGLRTVLNKWYTPDSFMLLIQNGQYMFQVVAGTTLYSVGAPAMANVWTHIAGVYDGAAGKLSLYLNGTLAAQTSATGTLQASGQPICIGNCPSWNAFAGAIDDVWLGSEALGPGQVPLLMGSCGTTDPADMTIWPNATSFVNSDPWIAAHHSQIQIVRPRVLVLNYANPSTPSGIAALVNQVIAGFAEASKPQGWLHEGAVSQLQFQIANGAIVDLRDGVNGRPQPPSGYPYQNSTLMPRRAAGNPWTFDYAQLFSAAYAPYLGFADPANPGQYFDLCTALGRGLVHEVWLVASQDVPDVSLAEVVGMMQMYDSSDHAIPGSHTYSAGNGMLNADVPWCGRSVRIGFINYTRGPGCYMHSYGHGIEGISSTNAIPELQNWFAPYAGFNLNTKYGLPFQSFYTLSCSTSPCIVYANNNATRTTAAQFKAGTTPITVNPFDPVCGNVHFAPNGTSHYDYGVSGGGLEPGVHTSCIGYGRHAGAGGADAVSFIDASIWQQYQVYGDCGGEFLTWWYQNMPQHGSGQSFAGGEPMLSIWPNMYY